MKSKLAIAAGAAVLLIGCEVANPPSEKAEAVSGAQPTEVAERASEEVSPTHTACIKASGGVTAAMLQCSHDELDRQDARLNANYKEAMAASSDKSGLRSIQRQWIKDRDATCAIDDDGGTAATLNHIECLVQETRKRANELGGSEAFDLPEVATAPMHADWFEEVSEEPKEEKNATGSPVTLTTHTEDVFLGNYHGTVTYVTMQSIVDEVVVESMGLNRGNCTAEVREPFNVDFPLTMKFGQTVKLAALGCKSVLEATASTSLGDYEFTFAQ